MFRKFLSYLLILTFFNTTGSLAADSQRPDDRGKATTRLLQRDLEAAYKLPTGAIRRNSLTEGQCDPDNKLCCLVVCGLVAIGLIVGGILSMVMGNRD